MGFQVYPGIVFAPACFALMSGSPVAQEVHAFLTVSPGQQGKLQVRTGKSRSP